MPVLLSGQSPLILLDRRLDELALPKHGTKLDKCTRIEKHENEVMRERKSQAAIEAAAAIPISDPREPSNTEKEVHELTHLPPQPSCEQNSASEEEVRRILTSGRRSKERNPHTLPVTTFDFCFIKTSGIVPGVTADEGATCLVFLDVDTGN